MEWTAIAGGALTCVTLANMALSNRLRGDMAELKLAVIEKVVEHDADMREWVEHKIERQEARLDAALKASG